MQLFDHFVGEGEQRGRNREPERPRGLRVDHELELGRLHDWQVRRFCTLQDATNINTRLAPANSDDGALAHRPTHIGNFEGR